MLDSPNESQIKITSSCMQDTAGNAGASETVTFTALEPFPTAAVAVASGAAIVVIVSIGLLYYRKTENKSSVCGLLILLAFPVNYKTEHGT